ncbi:ABC transporter permease [Streptomyces sp. NBC_01465]|uniref:ABC transporter permease n=1 Tax=Streptomyces sp. NBC_01465 TaxID=2903878 RepID=UPI002E374209|nr:ABC transporter permease [Streptomyces sp. NBC_01465]
MSQAVRVTPAVKVAQGKARSPWTGFLVRRLVGLAGVLVTLVVGTFLMIQLVPGDPARQVAGSGATAEQIEQVRHGLGLDRTLWEQFTSYVGGLLHGDLGTSFAAGRPVSQLIGDRLPFTAQLALIAMVVVLLVSVPLGMAVAVACRGGRRRWLDSCFTAVTAVAGAVPEYVLATVLVLVFAVTWGVLPAAGAASLSAMVLPVLAVSVGPVCTLARIVRRETATVLTQDYLRTARGHRLRAVRLYSRHALPNLLTSTLTLGGLILSGLLGGTVIVEIVFAWPGLGTGVVNAITARDYPVVQGIVLLLGLLATVLNLLVDIVLGLLDPRTLTGRTGPA